MKKLTKSQVIAKLKRLKAEERLVINMLPSKTSFSGFKTWVQPYEIELSKWDLNQKYPDNDNDLTFLDSYINEFSYYNCNSELGNRVHFYIKEDK